MSRIGKQPIAIPQGVEVKLDGQTVSVKGPKGALHLQLHPSIAFSQKEQQIVLTPSNEEKQTKMKWGTSRALLFNMIKGATDGFEKRLEIQGVGYKAQVKGKKLVLDLGFTNPVEIDIPEGLTVKVEKNIVVVSGVDKQLVGEFSANVRDFKRPEPYKGKGIRYVGEYVIRKEGKRAGAEGAA